VLNFKKPSRVIIVALVMFVVLSVGFALNKSTMTSNDPPRKTPLLSIVLIEKNQPKQYIQSAQLTNGWSFDNKDGTSTSYEADSFHPLQIPEGYDEITGLLSDISGEIALQFSDNNLPLSVSVQRWDAKYSGADSVDVWDSGEQIAVTDNAFQIFHDGNNYVYEVYAKWEQGYSWYVFRVDAAPNGLVEFEAIYSNVTDYSYSVQFKLGERIYSDYIVNGELQSAGGWRGLKEIGFAVGDKGEKYRIFERDGYSIDEFIVVQDDGFMNQTVIYVADSKMADDIDIGNIVYNGGTAIARGADDDTERSVTEADVAGFALFLAGTSANQTLALNSIRHPLFSQSMLSLFKPDMSVRIHSL
jgi:hypothetical protein